MSPPKEVNPDLNESSEAQGIFFCGEFLDINSYTGGYNITAAFVTTIADPATPPGKSFELQG